MFRTFLQSNQENSIFIQGARNDDSVHPIASVVLQNYDLDTRKTYNMGALSVVDHFGDADSNGYGDLILRTTSDSSNLVERMRVQYDGRVFVGTTACNATIASPALFNVTGDALVTGALAATNVSLSNITVRNYRTEKIYFNRDTSSNLVDTITLGFANSNSVRLDTACIVSGTLDPARLPPIQASTIAGVFPTITTSNLTAINYALTPRVVFSKSNTPQGNSTSGAFGLSSTYIAHTTFVPDVLTPGASLIEATTSRYTVLNSTTTWSFSLQVVIDPSQTPPTAVAITLPTTPAAGFALPVVLVVRASDSAEYLGKIVSVAQQPQAQVSLLATPGGPTLGVGTWRLAGSVVYESS